MSAYVVEDKTINRILAWLNTDEHEWERKRFQEKHPFSVLQDLGQALYDMNVEAVGQRYGNAPSTKRRFPYAHVKVSDVQVLSSLDCFLYQCMEGDVPQMPLYKALEELSSAIAGRIARDMQEYKDAEWG